MINENKYKTPKYGVLVKNYTEDETYFYVKDDFGIHKYAKSIYVPVQDVLVRYTQPYSKEKGMR